jgi:hypothetical protein
MPDLSSRLWDVTKLAQSVISGWKLKSLERSPLLGRNIRKDIEFYDPPIKNTVSLVLVFTAEITGTVLLQIKVINERSNKAFS